MQPDMPSVTVLMPAYNAARYIREAIESVLAQTYTRFEFLIINDGSTDDTEAIIRSYDDPRIRLYNQENQGVIGALNRGLILAEGEYIARFDADDVCYPERLSVQLDWFAQHPEGVLLGAAADYIDKDGHALFEWQPSSYEQADLANEVYRQCPFDHPTVMYRKEVALRLGGYPKGAIHFEDHLFWTGFFKEGLVANIARPLIKHRFNPESVTIDEKWRGPVFAEIKYRSIREGYVSETDEKTLRSLLQRQDLSRYKEAAYYGMVGKKYLWNRHDPRKARQHLWQAIRIAPGKAEPYLLYLLSFLPESFVKTVYKRFKK